MKLKHCPFCGQMPKIGTEKRFSVMGIYKFNNEKRRFIKASVDVDIICPGCHLVKRLSDQVVFDCPIEERMEAKKIRKEGKKIVEEILQAAWNRRAE